MSSYLVQASYTTEALNALLKTPQNRTEVVRKAIEKLGGSLTGLWLSFGDQDVVCIMEMPDNVSAAAISMAIAAGGALKSTKTTLLLTAEEAMAAGKKSATCGYKPISRKK
jgi:uncharacterized protein with GYD domain